MVPRLACQPHEWAEPDSLHRSRTPQVRSSDQVSGTHRADARPEELAGHKVDALFDRVRLGRDPPVQRTGRLHPQACPGNVSAAG